MKTFHTFKSPESFEKFLRTRYGNCHKSGFGCLDYVNVDGKTFTQHEYDMDGRTITWANKKHNTMIELTTPAGRYKYGYDDAIVEMYPANYLRDDIHYAE